MASTLRGRIAAFRAVVESLRPGHRRRLLTDLEAQHAAIAALQEKETFLTAVIEAMAIGVMAVDNDGRPVVWNAAARAAYEATVGADRPDWVGGFDLRHPDGSPITPASLPLPRALAGEQVLGAEFNAQVGGTRFALSIDASPIRLPDGTTVGVVCTGSDISKLHLREQELTRANADLDAIARATAQVLNGDDARQAVVEAARAVSDGVTAMLFEPTSAMGTTLAAVAQAGLQLPGYTVQTDGTSRTVEAYRTGKVQLVTDMVNDPKVDHDAVNAAMAVFGSTREIKAMIAVPVLQDGVPRAVLTVVFDYTVSTSNLRLLGLLELLATDAALAIAREDSARELTRLASTDPLTGLANRRSWDAKLEEEVERARRTGLPLCVVILDLDHFKRFNDSRGHQAGDQLLAAGAASWSHALRSNDTLARLGGEEFGVLLPGCTATAVPGLVDRLIKALPEGQTCSAGVAEWAGEVAGHTIARADEALYEAKRAGRATFRIASGEVSTGLPSPRAADAA